MRQRQARTSAIVARTRQRILAFLPSVLKRLLAAIGKSVKRPIDLLRTHPADKPDALILKSFQESAGVCRRAGGKQSFGGIAFCRRRHPRRRRCRLVGGIIQIAESRPVKHIFMLNDRPHSQRRNGHAKQGKHSHNSHKIVFHCFLSFFLESPESDRAVPGNAAGRCVVSS